MLSRLRRETRGAVMVMAAATFTVLLLFAGLALDFGRAHLLRNELQHALDAASLAGALQVVPMAELEIRRSVRIDDTCPDPVTGNPAPCTHWEPTSPVVLSGTQWDLITQKQWKTRAGARCTSPYRCTSYQVTREWLVLPESTVPVARSTFGQNARWPTGKLEPQVTDLTVTVDKANVEVTATATMTMPTTFLKIIGIHDLTFTRTGTAKPVKR